MDIKQDDKQLTSEDGQQLTSEGGQQLTSEYFKSLGETELKKGSNAVYALNLKPQFSKQNTIADFYKDDETGVDASSKYPLLVGMESYLNDPNQKVAEADWDDISEALGALKDKELPAHIQRRKELIEKFVDKKRQLLPYEQQLSEPDVAIVVDKLADFGRIQIEFETEPQATPTEFLQILQDLSQAKSELIARLPKELIQAQGKLEQQLCIDPQNIQIINGEYPSFSWKLSESQQEDKKLMENLQEIIEIQDQLHEVSNFLYTWLPGNFKGEDYFKNMHESPNQSFTVQELSNAAHIYIDSGVHKPYHESGFFDIDTYEAVPKDCEVVAGIDFYLNSFYEKNLFDLNVAEFKLEHLGKKNEGLFVGAYEVLIEKIDMHRKDIYTKKYKDLLTEVDKYLTYTSRAANKKHGIINEFKQDIQQLIENIDSAKNQKEMKAFVSTFTAKVKDYEKDIEDAYKKAKPGFFKRFSGKPKKVHSSATYFFTSVKNIASELLQTEQTKELLILDKSIDKTILQKHIKGIFTKALSDTEEYLKTKKSSYGKKAIVQKYHKELSDLFLVFNQSSKKEGGLKEGELSEILTTLNEVNVCYQRKLTIEHRATHRISRQSSVNQIFKKIDNKISAVLDKNKPEDSKLAIR